MERMEKIKLEEPRKSILKFLKDNGWNVVLVGQTGVVKNPNDVRKYKYWFIMEFLGSKERRLIE